MPKTAENASTDSFAPLRRLSMTPTMARPRWAVLDAESTATLEELRAERPAGRQKSESGGDRTRRRRRLARFLEFLLADRPRPPAGQPRDGHPYLADLRARERSPATWSRRLVAIAVYHRAAVLRTLHELARRRQSCSQATESIRAFQRHPCSLPRASSSLRGALRRDCNQVHLEMSPDFAPPQCRCQCMYSERK
jgi:hypothetical protein